MINKARQRFVRITDWLVDLRTHHIPQLFVATCGFFGIAVGFLFLVIPHRFNEAPALEFLINAVSPLWWGLAFFGLGVALFTTSVINYTKAVLPCFILGMVCFVFSGLSSLELFNGPATGLVVVSFAIMGWICWLAMIGSIAPAAQKGLHDHEQAP